MVRHVLSAALMLAMCVPALADKPQMKLKVTAGKALVWNKDLGGWTSVKDTMALHLSDSVFLDHNEAATLFLGTESEVLLKGLARVSLQGADLDVKILLVEGQLFLKRKKPYQFNTFSVVARGVGFTPIGTSGAVRFNKMGEPEVAMLEGKMRVAAPSGEAVLVEPGQSATFGRDGKFKTGKLPAGAVKSLEQWSGVTYQGPPPPTAEELAKEQEAAQQPEQVAAAEPAADGGAAAPAGSGGDAPAAGSGGGDSQAPAAAPADAGDSDTGDDKPADDGKASSGGGNSSSGGAAAPKTAATGQADEGEEGDEDAAEGDDGKDKDAGGDGAREKPSFEVGAAITTVDDEQWTLINFGVDLPIWKFGIFLDLEFWLDDEGQFSDKGWVFDEDTWYKSVFRKIRYLRFGHEGDPFFVKFGGLGSVDMGYGFVFDRFTNMLHYPDEKLLGLQLELNDISPIGITFQGLVGDFYDIKNTGGVIGTRLGFRFFKPTEKPLLKDLLIAGTFAIDRNLYAPARSWDLTLKGEDFDRDEDGIADGVWVEDLFQTVTGSGLTQAERDSAIANGLYDTVVEHSLAWAAREEEDFMLVGADIGLPLIDKKIVRLDLYGQMASRVDGVEGWGFGAPGLALRAGPMWAGIEYRHVTGAFEPGFFNTYYLDERLEVTTTDSGYAVSTKVDNMAVADDGLNGVYGELGFDIAGVFQVSATYQYLGRSPYKDQRYEGSAGIGSKIVERIPKLTKAELYIRKTHVHERTVYDKVRNTSTGLYEYEMVMDDFFAPSPYMYWGYRIGFEITEGAGLVWDTRHGYKLVGYKLKEDNQISIATAITF